MKYYETCFEDYVAENNRVNLHPKLTKIYDAFPDSIDRLQNVIFYGPQGTGKYTQMLSCIKKYSSTNLKYGKKLIISFNKRPYYFKVSDVHFEVDMALLGCKSKLLWFDIYRHIVDIISMRKNATGIIVCTNFHEIHAELLEHFYSYMQKNETARVNVRFVLITEQLSFIGDNILNCCHVIHVGRPSAAAYRSCVCTNSHRAPPFVPKFITNIKHLRHAAPASSPDSADAICLTTNVDHPYRAMCDRILYFITHILELRFLKFRDIIYDIFIYGLNIADCVWYIQTELVRQNKIRPRYLSDLMKQTYIFFKYYNNNYRPVYHLEKYLYFLISIIYEYGDEKERRLAATHVPVPVVPVPFAT